jgi:hypothetical protein
MARTNSRKKEAKDASRAAAPTLQDPNVIFVDDDDMSQDSDLARLEERARLLKARRFTESALIVIGSSRAHERLIDLYLDALREIEDALDKNVCAGLAPRTIAG